jgi:tetratricopeptide (TPR) repeat protein
MELRTSALLLLGLAVISGNSALGQNTGATVRHHREVIQDPAVTPEVTRAEAAMSQQDFPTAEKELLAATEKDPGNYRAWFDLGFVYNRTNRTPQAIDAYRKSVEANPEIFESTLNLGLLLAHSGSPDAEKYLRDATRLKPSSHAEEGWYRAWQSLGQVLQKSQPDNALEAFRNAAKLNPTSAEPHLSAALLLESQNKLSDALAEYQQAARLDPKSSEALAGMVNAYSRLGQLPDAESALRKYIELDPNNATAHLQLGRVLAAQKKYDEASAELEKGLQSHPNDPEVQKQVAEIYLAQKQYDPAIAHIRAALQNSSRDPQLHHWLGIAYLNKQQYPEALNELITAVNLKPDYGEAYGDLALAASGNKNYVLTIQALDARAKYLPEVPGTYFLRATAYDQLKDYKQASANYRQFLAVANGRFPDEEWKAKHRLIAIEPKK